MITDPQRDLRFQRDVPLSPEQLWDGWTKPDTLMRWFCPRPWKVIECDIDLRPGGLFRTVMQSPEGVNLPDNVGTYLAIEPPYRLVWTNALGPDFRPRAKLANDPLGFVFVVDLRFTPLPEGGTHYSALVMHEDEAGRLAHAALGFEQGWGMALDQLIELKTSGNAPKSI